jgi:hypothetical protein
MNQCPDYDFIMFPSGGSGDGLFSPQQSTVLQASTLYRGVFAPGEPPMPPYGPPLEGASSARSRLATPADRSAALDRVHARPRTAPPIGAWSAPIGDAAAAQLAGVGCPPFGFGESRFFEELSGLGASDALALLEIARDPSAPAHARSRAARMAAWLAERGEAGPSTTMGALDALVSDERAPALARAGALGALERLDADRARALASRLASSSERRLAGAAQGLLARRR